MKDFFFSTVLFDTCKIKTAFPAYDNGQTEACFSANILWIVVKMQFGFISKGKLKQNKIDGNWLMEKSLFYCQIKHKIWVFQCKIGFYFTHEHQNLNFTEYLYIHCKCILCSFGEIKLLSCTENHKYPLFYMQATIDHIWAEFLSIM